MKSSSVSGPPADAASQLASATSTAGRKCSDAKSIEEFAVEVLPGQEPVHRLTVSAWVYVHVHRCIVCFGLSALLCILVDSDMHVRACVHACVRARVCIGLL